MALKIVSPYSAISMLTTHNKSPTSICLDSHLSCYLIQRKLYPLSANYAVIYYDYDYKTQKKAYATRKQLECSAHKN